MELYKYFKSLDSKFSWSFMGFAVGILGFGYAVYIDQFKDENPEIVFDILSNTQVLSLKEDLNKLDIVYDGQNIKEKKENLILLTIRVSNEGNEDVRESDFYSQTPFGFLIKNGRIAEKPILIDATSDFLRQYLKITHDSLNRIIIRKVPIDHNQSFTIKVLTICRESTLPTIEPIGKITGVTDDFELRESFKGAQKEEKTTFEKIISGSLSIHLARFFSYIFCFVVLIGVLSFFISRISNFIDVEKKRKKIQKFRNKTKIELSEKSDFIFELYRNAGQMYLKWVYSVISNEEKLNAYMLYFKNRQIERFLLEDSSSLRSINSEILEEVGHRALATTIISKLVENNFVVEENGMATIDIQFKKELQEFIYFIDVQ